MRGYIILSAILLIGAALASESSTSTSPLFLWSNIPYFQGKNNQVKTLTPVESIQETLQNSGFISKTQKPETVIVFVQPNLNDFVKISAARTSKPDGGAFANLKKLVETSTSSVVIPYVLPKEGSISTHVVESLRSMIDGTTTIVSEKFDQEEFKKTSNNGLTDLIIVHFNGQFAEEDLLLNEYISMISSSTYVSIFTANESKDDNKVINKRFSQNDVRTLSKRLSQEDYTSSGNIWNRSIVTGLVLMVPFIIILIVGLRCGFDIQSEINFEKPLSSKKNL